MTERLETPRLVLRPLAPGDWPQARAFLLSDRTGGIGGPFTATQAWILFAAEVGHWAIHGFGLWAVTRRGDDTAVGVTGPWLPDGWPETEVGWMIYDPDLEGTGIATEAARAAIDHAWRVLKWDTVVSYVAPDNTRSSRLALKLGAVLDEDAPQPLPNKRSLVYRHPRPEDLA